MVLLNLVLLIAFVILWLLSKKYQIDVVNSLDEKEYHFKALYPFGFYLMDKFGLYKKKSSNHLEEPLKAVYVGEQMEIVKRLYLCNKVVVAALIIFAANFFGLISGVQSFQNKQLLEGNYLLRPGYEQGSKSVDLKVNVSEKDTSVLEEEIHIELEEKQYDEAEIRKQFQHAKDYIDAHLLNNNQSPEHVLSDLKFITKIPDTRVSVTWTSDNSEIIDTEGKVHNEELGEGVLIPITAKLIYQDMEEEYTRYFKVLPKVYTREELTRKSLTEALSAADKASKMQDKLPLPDSLNQQRVSWAENENNTGGMLLIFGVIAAILLYFLMDRDLYGKVEKRNREMLLDYPEIINKFTLLVGAGMSFSNAWNKISKDYKEKGGKKRYAYEEMVITYGELMLGTSEITAYERFGRRVKLIPYLRFSSLLAQNVKKGSSGLLSQLELEAAEAFEERKELAKRMGEEAGTKLLFPMILMLLLVLAVIMVPALISFQI
ncbi:hypothetical protein QA584_00275 [Anaerocolumna sp. AGMB13025]|uniref:hypothetical protein n=1 Tax=Anaerocolumna sp. AGMB13025 TaxID=3039116 RepID=UPI00241E4477|nr:hypothetical protein [Anaerocolumna sp. AGMB13025]WFR57554.1 hypothetical protein QA584_00275 [Anaerocolumna sp. AGMB13025]